ncbi:MAG: GAF domain-containing protein [Chlorobi bacterium CHB2]|nr:GAF domain-containing protein [Chlorobi bacterium CHB2]
MSQPSKPAVATAITLPRWSRAVSIVAIAVAWVCVLLYDLLTLNFTDPLDAGHGFFRTLFPLVGFVPFAARLFQPEDIATDAEAYETYTNITLITAIAGVFGLVAYLLIFTWEDFRLLSNIWAFIVGRLVALVAYVAVPLVAEGLLRLYRYRSKLAPSKIALGYSYGLAVLVIIPLFVAFFGDLQDVREVAYMLSGLLGVMGFLLSVRGGWIVNLRKRQKLKLLLWAMVGGLACLPLMPETTELAASLYGFFPGLLSLTFGIIVSMLVTQVTVFFNTMLALPTAEAIDRRNIEVSSLANFARLLTQSFDSNELTDTAIAITCSVTRSQAAWIELGEGATRELLYGTSPKLPAAVAQALMDARATRQHSISEAVRKNERVEMIGQTGEGRWALKNGTTRALRSVAAAPLRSGNKLIGTLFVAKEQVFGFDREHLTILEVVAHQIALSIEQSRLIQQSFERERFEQEMLIARTLQQQLLPKTMPNSLFHEVHAESEPASIVGGDYYDTIAFSDHTIGIVVGDVSGKGASAALYMGMVKGIVQAFSGECATPKEFLIKVNHALHGTIDHRWFVTMTCAQIIDEERTLRIARAGHCPTLVLQQGKAWFAKSPGIGLGIAKPALFQRTLQEEVVKFMVGDYAIFFSDGLPEARNPQGDELEYERLRAIVERAAAAQPSPQEMRDAIFEGINKFTDGESLVDDTTLVVLRWR